MSHILAVSIDGQVQLEFDHAKPVPEPQLAYLDDMDTRMQAGFELQGEHVSEPDIEAKVKFVAQNLATALLQGDERLAAAMCTWLGVRRPQLLQVKISSGELGLSVDLDYETPYEKPAPQPQVVQFHPNKLNS